MSISPVIDQNYRLAAHDLGRRDHLVTIGNVSWQGVETLTPLLHLTEFPSKRFLLDAPQQQELIRLLGTSHTEKWIGQKIVIAAQSDSDQLRIHLFAPADTHKTKHLSFSAPVRVPDSMRATVILLCLLILLFILVALLDQSDSFWQWLAQTL